MVDCPRCEPTARRSFLHIGDLVSKPTKSCACIEGVNKALAARSAKLVTMMSLTGGPTHAIIATQRNGPEKRDAWKAPTLVATFCPFCGKKYPVHKPKNDIHLIDRNSRS
jgi:hypothetical protein